MIELLNALQLGPKLDNGRIRCTIPSRRLDMKREVDLIEEVARLHGFDQVPQRERISISASGPQASVEARRLVGRVLSGRGYCEAISFSFVAPHLTDLFAAPNAELVQVDDERKKAEPVLRPSVLLGLLAVRKRNQDAGNRDLRLFEAASVYGSAGGATVESRHVAMLADAESPDLALRQMRGTIEELAGALGKGVHVTAAASSDAPRWAQPAALVTDADETGRVLGVYGLATDEVLARFDLNTPVALASLDYDALLAGYPPQTSMQPLPRFPGIERDLSVVVDESITWEQIEQAVQATQGGGLEAIEFLTVYRGKQIGRNRKSVSFRLTFRDPDRTLRHEEVDPQVNAVVDRLKQELAAELRT